MGKGCVTITLQILLCKTQSVSSLPDHYCTRILNTSVQLGPFLKSVTRAHTLIHRHIFLNCIENQEASFMHIN